MEHSQYLPRTGAALAMATGATAVRVDGRTGTGITVRAVDVATLLALLTSILLSGYMVAVG